MLKWNEAFGWIVEVNLSVDQLFDYRSLSALNSCLQEHSTMLFYIDILEHIDHLLRIPIWNGLTNFFVSHFSHLCYMKKQKLKQNSKSFHR